MRVLMSSAHARMALSERLLPTGCGTRRRSSEAIKQTFPHLAETLGGGTIGAVVQEE
jgi:hypothetical protein